MKCHKYWPDVKEPETHNDMYTVTLAKEEELDDFATTVRTFTLTNIKVSVLVIIIYLYRKEKTEILSNIIITGGLITELLSKH
jgi:hypothetical protein